MPSLPPRSVLEGLKRAEIQGLCKDYGVRANLKTEALIDLLVNEFSDADPIQRAPPPQPRQASSRKASIPHPLNTPKRTRSMARSRDLSTRSIVIHETDEETENMPELVQENESDVKFLPPDGNAGQRKAKDGQRTLGVGRPVAAGGTGVRRSLTRVPTVAKAMRTRSRPTITRTDTIPEEDRNTIDKPEALTPPNTHATYAGKAALHDDCNLKIAELQSQLDELRDQVNELVPLQSRMRAVEATVADLSFKLGELITVSEFIQPLSAEVQQLRQLKDVEGSPRVGEPPAPGTLFGPQSSTPAPCRTPTRSGKERELTLNPSTMTPVPTTLGKRNRDSPISTPARETEVANESQQLARPQRKRPRTHPAPVATLPLSRSHSPVTQDQRTEDAGHSAPFRDTQEEAPNPPRLPSFTVFSGPSEDASFNYVDPPPPTARLPDFFPTTTSPTNRRSGVGGPFGAAQGHGFATRTANASENQNPYGFSATFLNDDFHSEYPFITPTLSPPPSSDPYTSLATMPLSGGEGNTTTAGVRPSRHVSSTEVGLILGFQPFGSPMVQSTRRTMYGTEVENDLRFGDFGVAGMASGMWTGAPHV